MNGINENGGREAMIRPGLQRISGLLQGIELPWKAIHIAGTNGKGSVCAYLSAMLHTANIRTGRFTSPHIIDRWDCISIDESPVSESLFRKVEDKVKARNEQENIGATSFEILTATAFEVFNHEHVDVGIVECGMGGRLDSTNVLAQPIVTVITRIGKDHEAFLGDTLDKIALEKAGILKAGSPAVVEWENDFAAMQQIQSVAQELNIHMVLTPPMEYDRRLLKLLERSPEARPLSTSEIRNMWLAYTALNLALPALGKSKELAKGLAPAMAGAGLPGRFQQIELQSLNSQRTQSVILDGAHNAQALEQLSGYLSTALPPRADQPRTWLIACSAGKDIAFSQAVAQSDHVVITQFSPVDGMPWVSPKPVEKIMPQRATSETNPRTIREPDLPKAIQQACAVSDNGPMVITGSLYLASDVLRLLKQAAPSAEPQSS